MNDFGASHWGSEKVWNRRIKQRKSPTECKYSITIKIGDEDMNRLDELEKHFQSIIEEVNWGNRSALVRQCIKLAFAKMMEDKIRIEEKAKSIVA